MKIIKRLISNDKKVIKYLQQAKDGYIIETGYYNLDESIICISSQIGCPMSCIFCSTGAPIDELNPNKYFIRNLTCEEIVKQVRNLLCNKELKLKRILLSYMGMGEPFLNYKNVVKSIKILSNEFINSRTTIATVGVKPVLMRKLANEEIDTTLKLHLSLHAPDNSLRKQILPKSGKIKPALDALKYFSLKRNIPLKVNYILIKDFNDSEKFAFQLAKLLKPYPFIVKLSNLNNFNNLESSGIEKFTMFEKILNSYGIRTCRFFSTGTDIQAGCGQLRRHYYKVKYV
ncbi:hypothetical protein AMJ47_04125 [Parcubacteria bacterium DG_72]|nr:MAG: hypothetical protein AMJ47_04125 [Parcubacteria bacterium DG_72]